MLMKLFVIAGCIAGGYYWVAVAWPPMLPKVSGRTIYPWTTVDFNWQPSFPATSKVRSLPRMAEPPRTDAEPPAEAIRTCAPTITPGLYYRKGKK